MFAMMKKFFTDETAFIRMGRGGAAFLATLIMSGTFAEIPVPTWVPAALMGFALAMGAGDKNPKTPTQ